MFSYWAISCYTFLSTWIFQPVKIYSKFFFFFFDVDMCWPKGKKTCPPNLLKYFDTIYTLNVFQLSRGLHGWQNNIVKQNHFNGYTNGDTLASFIIGNVNLNIISSAAHLFATEYWRLSLSLSPSLAQQNRMSMSSLTERRIKKTHTQWIRNEYQQCRGNG